MTQHDPWSVGRHARCHQSTWEGIFPRSGRFRSCVPKKGVSKLDLQVGEELGSGRGECVARQGLGPQGMWPLWEGPGRSQGARRPAWEQWGGGTIMQGPAPPPEHDGGGGSFQSRVGQGPWLVCVQEERTDWRARELWPAAGREEEHRSGLWWWRRRQAGEARMGLRSHEGRERVASQVVTWLCPRRREQSGRGSVGGRRLGDHQVRVSGRLVGLWVHSWREREGHAQ